MSEINRIRKELRNEVQSEFMEGILKRVIEGLTPKERKVLGRLALSTDEIAKALNCKPHTISQVLCRIYSKFSETGIVDFKGRNKRATMIEAWRKIQEQYGVPLVSRQGS